MNAHPHLVLFSGGRDSSLAACQLATEGHPIHLLTCNNGASIGTDLVDYRVRELKDRLGDKIRSWDTARTVGLFRRIAIASIEADFAVCPRNLIVLGSQLAMHAEAIIYCRSNDVSHVASGFTSYQQTFPEQMPSAIALFKSFFQEYGITYSTPIYHFVSPDDVKYRLLDFGVSTKSLEAVSLFADSFSTPTPAEVTSYIDRKLPICREYIAMKCPSATSDK